jgi:hypothetical protein
MPWLDWDTVQGKFARMIAEVLSVNPDSPTSLRGRRIKVKNRRRESEYNVVVVAVIIPVVIFMIASNTDRS